MGTWTRMLRVAIAKIYFKKSFEFDFCDLSSRRSVNSRLWLSRLCRKSDALLFKLQSYGFCCPRFCPRRRARPQGCQIFLGAWYQNRKNVPKEHKMYQMEEYTFIHKKSHKRCKLRDFKMTALICFTLSIPLRDSNLGLLLLRRTRWH
jgi:hypothetical protein